MASLASIEDLELRLGTEFTEDQRPRIQQLLDDASALVRSFTRQKFEYVEDDVIVLRPVGSYIRLPQTPVVEVSKIEAVAGYNDMHFTLSAWSFDGIDKIQLFAGLGQVVNYPEWWYDNEGVNTYRVTYSHGYPTGEGEAGIPDDIVAAVCAMVMRVVTSPSQVGGMVSERIGQYFYQLQQNQGAAGASVRLNADDKSALAAYRKSATTIQTSVA